MESSNAHFATADTIQHDAITRSCALSWPAIFAGAAAAAVLSLIFLLLGIGLGFSSISPWAPAGVSGTTFSVSTILWITITSLIASAMGGYLAGRLRSRWFDAQPDEVHFRDTAHGFLAWAMATLITATLLASTIDSIVSGTIHTSASLVGVGMLTTAASGTGNGVINKGSTMDSGATSFPYFMHRLFRDEKNSDAVTNENNPPTNNLSPNEGVVVNQEMTGIFTHALWSGKLEDDDSRYGAQLIVKHTHLNQQEAEKRMVDMFNALQTQLRDAEIMARNAADQARKAFAYGSLWLFISLLISAFVASLSAVYGGRLRDL